MIAAVMGPDCRNPKVEIAEFRTRRTVAATPPDLAFPGMDATLAEAGETMAICSSKLQPMCEKILADMGLAEHFAAIHAQCCTSV